VLLLLLLSPCCYYRYCRVRCSSVLSSKISAKVPSIVEMPSQCRQSIPPFVVKAATIASLGGILFGYDLGCISGALPQMASTFSFTERQQEMVVSFLYLGGGLGAAIGGSLCDTAGRRTAILVTDVIFLVGAAALYFSRGLLVILIGRIIMGFAVAVSAIADVSYLHEISPTEWRGSVVSANEACISLGFLVAYILGYFISLSDPVNGWRTIFGISGFVAVIQFAGMIPMPESPVWLREQGRLHDANEAMKIISGGDGWCGRGSTSDEDCVCGQGDNQDKNGSQEKNKYVDSPINTTYSAIDDMQQPHSSLTTVQGDQHGQTNYSSLLHERSRISENCKKNLRQLLTFCQEMHDHRRQVSIAVFLAIAQQFCGHTNILNYAPEIVRQMGLDSKHYTLGFSILIGTVKFVVTLFVIWRIEFLGRRSLLIGGMGVIAASTLMLTIAFWNQEHGDEEYMTPASAAVSLVAMIGVAAGYAASFAPLTWLLISEMFHPKFRGRALGSSTIITYLSAALVSFFFLSAQSKLGPSFPFMAYCIITVLGVFFAAFAIPDTGGKDPNEIEADMKQMRWWRWRDGEASLWQRRLSQARLVPDANNNNLSSSQMQLV